MQEVFNKNFEGYDAALSFFPHEEGHHKGSAPYLSMQSCFISKVTLESECNTGNLIYAG